MLLVVPGGLRPSGPYRRRNSHLRWAYVCQHPSQGLRTLPGPPFLQFKGPGYGCPSLRRVMCLPLNRGLGPDGALTSLRYRSVAQPLCCHRRTLSAFRDLPCWRVALLQQDLLPLRILLRPLQCSKMLFLPPRAFVDFFRVPRPLLSSRRLRAAYPLRRSSWPRNRVRPFLKNHLQL